MKNENSFLEQHVKKIDDIYKVLDAVYSMGRTTGKRPAVKQRETENKEWRRLKNLIKDVEGTIALSLNEMHRRKVNFMRLSRKEKVCQHYADGLHKFWWKKLRRT